eukprot:m.39262 g.39262  ORF g.39262 m.39262 type:complete len:423 (+) comp12655_c0_seq1:112-1380(+)
MRFAIIAALAALASSATVDQDTDSGDVVRTLVKPEGLWQLFKPRWTSDMTEIHIKMGSIEPCRRFQATLHVYRLDTTVNASSDLETLAQVEDASTSLLTQSVTTTCSGCVMSSNTCLLTPACTVMACLAWQTFSLSSSIPVTANSQLVFALTDFTSSGEDTLPASVGVAPTKANHGGVSNLPVNPSMYTTAPTQYSFRTVMSTSAASVGERQASAPASSSNKSSTAVVAIGAVVAIALVAVLLLFVRGRRHMAIGDNSSSIASTELKHTNVDEISLQSLSSSSTYPRSIATDDGVSVTSFAWARPTVATSAPQTTLITCGTSAVVDLLEDDDGSRRHVVDVTDVKPSTAFTRDVSKNDPGAVRRILVSHASSQDTSEVLSMHSIHQHPEDLTTTTRMQAWGDLDVDAIQDADFDLNLTETDV